MKCNIVDRSAAPQRDQDTRKQGVNGTHTSSRVSSGRHRTSSKQTTVTRNNQRSGAHRATLLVPQERRANLRLSTRSGRRATLWGQQQRCAKLTRFTSSGRRATLLGLQLCCDMETVHEQWVLSANLRLFLRSGRRATLLGHHSTKVVRKTVPENEK